MTERVKERGQPETQNLISSVTSLDTYGREMWVWDSDRWVVRSQHLPCPGDLGKLLHLSQLQFCHPYKAENNTYSKGCWENLKGKWVHDECLAVPVIAVMAGLTAFFLFLKRTTQQYLYPLSNPPNRRAFYAGIFHKEELNKSHRDGAPGLAEATCTRCVLGSSLDNVSQKKNLSHRHDP